MGLLNKKLEYYRNEEEFHLNDYIETLFEGSDPVQKDSIVNSVKAFEGVISESTIAIAEKSYKRQIKTDVYLSKFIPQLN